jgi:hypothetical protein
MSGRNEVANGITVVRRFHIVACDGNKVPASQCFNDRCVKNAQAAHSS